MWLNFITIDHLMRQLHSPFNAMIWYQPSTRAYRLLPLKSAIVEVMEMLALITNIRDVVKQLFKLYYKERTAARSTRIAPLFQIGDLINPSTKGLHIRS